MAKPNILIITADQMRADAMGFTNDEVISPNLDRLAAEGLVFERAYCTSPVCTPSRASILTGRLPCNTGAWNIGVSVSESEKTICDWLKTCQYRTVASGKMHFRPQMRDDYTNNIQDPAVRDRVRSTDGTYYGFDEIHLTEDVPAGEYLDWVRAVAPQYADSLGKPEGFQGDCWESEMPEDYHQTRWIGQKSIEAIEKHDTSQPLFLWTSFVDPHHPFNPPKRFADLYEGRPISLPQTLPGEHDLRPEHLRYQRPPNQDNGNWLDGYWPGGGQERAMSEDRLRHIRRNYYAMITFLDDEIGKILQALERKGMRDNTLIVFTADHGEWLGDHGLLTKGPWMYESLVRVPMIFHGPPIRNGIKSLALMENTDILPTLLDLIGEPIPYGIQGVSQKTVLQDQADAATGTSVVGDAATVTSTVRDSAITSYDAHDRGIHVKSLRTDRYKLVVFAGESYGELYDLAKDPGEFHNCFFDPDYQAVRGQLFEIFTHRLIQDQDPLPERKALW